MNIPEFSVTLNLTEGPHKLQYAFITLINSNLAKEKYPIKIGLNGHLQYK